MKVDPKATIKGPHAADFPKAAADSIQSQATIGAGASGAGASGAGASGAAANNASIAVTPKLSDKPNRTLPALIDEVLAKGIEVELTKEGYKIAGFYGMPSLPIQDSQQPGVLIATDHKGKKHVVKGFVDLIALNNLVWKGFYKQDDKYRRPDSRWFTHLYESGQMELVPGKTKD